MKKIRLIALITVLAALFTTGCINVNVKAPEPNENEPAQAETFDYEDYEADEIQEADEEIPDLLKGYDVMYPGELDNSAPETRQLVKAFLDEMGFSPEQILMVNVNDYESTGEYSAFIFAGKWVEADNNYEGTMYFEGDDGAWYVDQGTEYWRSIDGCMDFSSRTYALAVDNSSVTELITHMWEVRDGKPQGTCISCEGEIYLDDEGTICLVVSAH